MADTTREAKIVVSADDRASRVLRQIGRNLQGAARSSGLSRIAREMGGVRRAAAPLVASTGRLAGALGGLSAIAAGLTFAGAIASLRSFTAEMDNLAKLGRQTGFTVQQLRDLQFVGENVGVAGEAIENSIKGMTKRLGEAKAGTGSLYTYLGKTNKALLNQVTAAESGSAAFEILISALRQMPDATARNALAAAAFGRSGQDLVRFAQESPETIRQLIELGQRVGGVVSDEDANKAEVFNDALFHMQYALKGLRNEVAKSLMPELTPMVTSLRDWVAANRELVAGKIVSGIHKLVDLFTKVNWERVGRTFERVADAGADLARSLSGFVGGPENLIIGSLAALALAPFGAAIAGLAGTAVALSRLGGALLTTRIGRLGLIAGGIYELINAAQGAESFGDFVENLRNMSTVDMAVTVAALGAMAMSVRDIAKLGGAAAKGIGRVAGAGSATAAADLATGGGRSRGGRIAENATSVAAGRASPKSMGGLNALLALAKALGPIAAAASFVQLGRVGEARNLRNYGSAGYLQEFAGVTPTDDVEKAMFRLAAQALDTGKAVAEVRTELKSWIHLYRTGDAETKKRMQDLAPPSDSTPSAMGISEEADKIRQGLAAAGQEGGRDLADGVAKGGADAERSAASTALALSAIFGGMGADFFNAGSNVMRQLAAGIRSGTPEVQAAAAAAAGTVADHFPQSPARRGPLRMLSKMGREIVSQLAGGMDPARAGLAAAGVAGAIHAGLSGTDVGAFRAEMDAMRAAIAVPARGGASTARLEIALRGAPAGAAMSYSEKGRPLFDDVGLDTGRSMPRGRG